VDVSASAYTICVVPNIKATFGLRIRELRQAKGISQEALADKSGLDRTYISSISMSENVDFIEEMQDWMKATRKLTKKSSLKFIPRLHLKFPVPLDELVKHLIQKPSDKTWHESVIEIWRNDGNWSRVYLAQEES
jgi:transcriptional regulator with XRE-family HTH domain